MQRLTQREALLRALAHSLLLAGLVAGAASHAQEPGKVTDPVVTAADARQSYALYLPSAYNTQKKWPVIIVFDPFARGAAAIEPFRAAAEKHGYILAGSNNSRNGPAQPSLDAFVAMYNDVRARFRVDDARVYTAGLSGGARVAGMAAASCDGCVRAVIACGAGLPALREDARRRLPAYYFTVGRYDFNYFEILGAARRMSGPRAVAVFDGAHEWPPADVAERALAWLDAGAKTTEVPEPTAEEERQQKRQDELFQRVASLLTTSVQQREERERSLADARHAMAELKTQREGAQGEDAVVLRRALGQVVVSAFELAQQLKREGDGELYAEVLAVAAEGARPNPELYHELAAAWAAAGNKKKALAALQRAVELGFKDKQALAANKSFDRLRTSEEFQAIVNRMR